MALRYQLGGFNDKKVYYLYPHYADYFSQVFSQFQKVDWSERQHLHNIAEVIHNIMHDVPAGNIKYFEEFEAIIYKIDQV